jgi:hypothetical protein
LKRKIALLALLLCFGAVGCGKSPPNADAANAKIKAVDSSVPPPTATNKAAQKGSGGTGTAFAPQ